MPTTKINNEVAELNNLIKKEFVSTFHSLYTNLEYIKDKDGANLCEQSKANIRRAQSAIQRLNLLSDDIGAYFALYDTEHDLCKMELAEAISEVASKFEKRFEDNGVVLQTGDLLPVVADRKLLINLLTRIIENCVKFKSEFPLVIKIRSGLVSGDHSPALFTGKYVKLEVKDNGIGFPLEENEKVFELFYKCDDKSKKGSGVGLSICKKIMDLHNGYIRASTLPGQGTTISCYFPVLVDGGVD